MRLDDVFNDRESKTRSAQIARPGFVGAIEPFKDAGDVISVMPMPLSVTSTRIFPPISMMETVVFPFFFP